MVVFLLAYYRVLGVIAIFGLAVYAIYFYALIKLIPITLTLPGIAGLILTIGVAADANIVIFERVKEEIRGGRSIRQGIATGYRKGLTAIIDANVVTIMTAFILFVLATADVQGFAFTLGIGTFVSLFTAVMATQAILMTMGNSRDDLEPVDARRGRREAHLAVRLHGRVEVLLLDVGRDPADRRAGDRRQGPEPRDRLHLGHADHRRARAARDAAAGDESLLTSEGVSSPTVQKVTGDKTLGPNAYQISSKKLPAGGRDKLADRAPEQVRDLAKPARTSTTPRSARRSGGRSPTARWSRSSPRCS